MHMGVCKNCDSLIHRPIALFLIYINDLPECVNHSEIRLFADDCIVYRCIHNQQDAELLQEDINAIQTWAST